MFQIKKINFLLVAILWVLGACSGSDGAVGTIINRPGLPSTNIFPDFDSALPQPDSDTASASLSVKWARAATVDDATAGTDTPPEIWSDLFYDGDLTELHDVRNTLLNAGEIVAEAIEALSLEEIPTTLTTISTSSSQLVETTAAWEIEFILEPGTTDFMRFYFRNIDTGLLQATYLAQYSDGDAIQGIFAYVNSDALAENTGTGKRLYAMAFDFSDSTQNALVERGENYQADLARYQTTQFHYECDSSTDDCIGEPFLIDTPPPTRDFSAGSDIRFSWNATTYQVCLATMNYDNETISTGTTYSFTATTTGLPDASEIQTDVCTLSTPLWGAHVFTVDDLLERYEDTTPVGGTSLSYFVDGYAKTGWDTLTTTVIETWLDGSGL